MGDEAGQRSQNGIGVVGVVVATFSVGDGHDSVNVIVAFGRARQPGFQLPDKSARAGRRSKKNDHVTRTDAPAARSGIPFEVTIFVVAGNLLAGREAIRAEIV